MQPNRLKAAFTLIELVVVIAILAILAGVMIPRVTNRLAQSRDARRLSDMRAIKNAIDQYFVDKRAYPPAVPNAAAGGWDVSTDGGFIPALVDSGYLTEAPKDPTNDATYYYKYLVYAQGANACVGDTPYYVLAIRTFENSDIAAVNKGGCKCTGKDWATEGAWVAGGGASFVK